MAEEEQTDPSDETEIDRIETSVAERLLDHDTGDRAASEESRAETVANEADELSDAARQLADEALDRFGPDDERRAEFDDEGRGQGEA